MAQTGTKLSYRVSELAEATGFSIEFVRKQIREKKLSARKVGDAVIVLKEDVDRWLNSAVEAA